MHGPGDAIFLILNLFSTKINLEHGTFGITFIRHGLNIFENYFFGLKNIFNSKINSARTNGHPTCRGFTVSLF